MLRPHEVLAAGRSPLCGVTLFLTLGLVATGLGSCTKVSEKGDTPDTADTADTAECETMSLKLCTEHYKYRCDDCNERVYICSIHDDEYRWLLTGWYCECVNDEGEIEEYDHTTGTGNWECQEFDD